MKKLLIIFAFSFSCNAQMVTNIYYGKPVLVYVLNTIASNEIPVVILVSEKTQWALKRTISRQINQTNPVSVTDVTNLVFNMIYNQLMTMTRYEDHLLQQEEHDALLKAHPEIRRRVRDLLGITNTLPPIP